MPVGFTLGERRSAIGIFCPNLKLARISNVTDPMAIAICTVLRLTQVGSHGVASGSVPRTFVRTVVLSPAGDIGRGASRMISQ